MNASPTVPIRPPLVEGNDTGGAFFLRGGKP